MVWICSLVKVIRAFEHIVGRSRRRQKRWGGTHDVAVKTTINAKQSSDCGGALLIDRSFAAEKNGRLHQSGNHEMD
jgi:hypothetical protein